MATVPQYEIGKVKDSPVSGGFQQIQTNSDAFGAGIAQANVQRGQALSQMGEEAWGQAFQTRDIQDQATLRERDNLLSAKIRELISDDGGYLSLTGRAAVDAKANIEIQLAAYKKELAKDINPRILPKYNQVSDQRLSSAYGNMDSHYRTQNNAWNQFEREVRITGQIENTISAYDNPGQMELEFNLGITEVNSKLLDVYGIDAAAPKDDTEKAIVANETLKYTTKVHEGVINNLVAQERYKPAQDHFDDNMGAIDASQHAGIIKSLQLATRKGESLLKVDEIRGLGLDIEKQLVEARKISDPLLQESVVKGLKARFDEDNKIQQYDEGEALKEVHKAIADGAKTREDIDADVWARLSDDSELAIEDLFQRRVDAEDQRQDEIKSERYTEARESVYKKLALNQEITTDDLMAMSGTDFYTYKKNIRSDLIERGSDVEKAAYQVINAKISEGMTYKDIQKENQKEWDAMSGEAQRQIKALLDTTEEKRKDDSQTDMYDEAARLVAQGSIVIESMYAGMSGLQELDIKNKIQSKADNKLSRTDNAQTRLENESYDAVLKYLVAGGSYDELSKDLWAKLSGSQQTSITSALDTKAAAVGAAQLVVDQQEQYYKFKQMAQNDPAAFALLDLSIYKGTVTPGNFNKLVDMQTTDTGVDLYASQDSIVEQALGSLGLNMKTLAVEKGDDGDDVRRFLNEVDVKVAAHFADTQKQITTPEFKEIVTALMTDLVWNSVNIDEQEPLILAMDEAEDLYIKVAKLNAQGKPSSNMENIQLSEIRDVERTTAIAVMKQNNIPVTAQGIAELSTVPVGDVEDIVKAMKELKMSVSVLAIRQWYEANLNN